LVLHVFLRLMAESLQPFALGLFENWLAGYVDGILILFMDDFERARFFDFEANGELSSQTAFMTDRSIIDVITPKEDEPIYSNLGYSKSGDAVIKCLINFNIESLNPSEF
jgi:hypothetical protein